ncbi:hypothetical protein SynSYN20_01428 [Synechococcus sp. SYN20]|nr:hypothetical protein SynSYN20_01428 [Synechococcus sp. SYN20]
MAYRFESYSSEFNQDKLGCSANTRSEKPGHGLLISNQNV